MGSFTIGTLLFLNKTFRCKKLREEAMDEEMINAKKDTTRPSNVYYGLNWGYRSDNTVHSFVHISDREVSGHR